MHLVIPANLAANKRMRFFFLALFFAGNILLIPFHFFYFATVAYSHCEVGDTYDQLSLGWPTAWPSVQGNGSNGSVSVGEKWILNTGLPANCSGTVHSYTIKFYNELVQNSVNYHVTIAIWKQVGPVYIKVLKAYSFIFSISSLIGGC